MRRKEEEDKTRAAFLMVTVEKREDGRDIPRRKKKWATTFRVLVFRVSKVVWVVPVWTKESALLGVKEETASSNRSRRERERERERKREKNATLDFSFDNKFSRFITRTTTRTSGLGRG